MTQLEKKIEKGKGMTHAATFHADDILSTCLLKLINPEIEIIRSNSVPDEYDGIVYDIGMGEYDHHQTDARCRGNGIKYAAFGLLWKDLSGHFMDKSHASVFDSVFVSEMDRCDNGPDTNLLISSIKLFNPIWDSSENENVQFEKAVKLCMPMMEALIYHFSKSTYIPRYCPDLDECMKIAFQNIYYRKYQEKLSIPIYSDMFDVWENEYYRFTPNASAEAFYKTFLCQTTKTYGRYRTSPFVIVMSCLRKKDRIKILEKIMERRFQCINAAYRASQYCEEVYTSSARKDLIILDRYAPFDTLTETHSGISAVAFPTARNGYAMICVQKKFGKGFSIPSELAGKPEEELRKKYPGLSFVHPAGHMLVCDDEKDIINIYEKIANS